MLSLERTTGLDDQPPHLLDDAATWLLAAVTVVLLALLALGLPT